MPQLDSTNSTATGLALSKWERPRAEVQRLGGNACEVEETVTWPLEFEGSANSPAL